MNFYTRKLSDLTLEMVLEALKVRIKENTQLDFKRDLPGNLAKTLSSFANTFGGCVILGIEENDDGTAKLPPYWIDIKGLTEQIRSIAIDAITPPLDVEEIQIFENPDDKTKCIAILKVLEGEGVYAINQNSDVYLRVHNISDKINKAEIKADINEIQFLQNKISNVVNLRNKFLERSQKRLDKLFSTKTSKIINDTCLSTVIYPSSLKSEFLKPGDLMDYILKNIVSGYPYYQYDLIRKVLDGVVIHSENKYYDFHTNGFFINYDVVGSSEKAINSLSVFERIKKLLHFSSKFFQTFGYFGNIQIEICLNNISDFNIYYPFDEWHSKTKNQSLDNSIEYKFSGNSSKILESPNELLIPFLQKIYSTFDLEVSDEQIVKFIQKIKI